MSDFQTAETIGSSDQICMKSTACETLNIFLSPDQISWWPRNRNILKWSFYKNLGKNLGILFSFLTQPQMSDFQTAKTIGSSGRICMK